jgi:pimeloyl-ACP methyl ester carboxylesterase
VRRGPPLPHVRGDPDAAIWPSNVKEGSTVINHRRISVNGLSVHIAEQGEGPLVLLLHGWPESWYSWRHQFRPLAEAGYHVVAPDQRGYGDTDRPDGVGHYTILHLVADVAGLILALGERQAVVVGHDWGAPVAWQTALLRPDLVRGVAGLSVPPAPRGPIPPLTRARQRFGEGFYQIYFQRPGVAEAELSRDIPATFRKVLTVFGQGIPVARPGAGLLDSVVAPDALPDWLDERDIAVFAEQYTRSGFTGGLNWYRNIDRNWELTAAWQDRHITAPALYVTGERDSVRGFYPPGFLTTLPAILPNLHAVVDLPGCGHWTQQERPHDTNTILLEFLKVL